VNATSHRCMPILNALPWPAIVFGPNGSLQTMNEAAEELFRRQAASGGIHTCGDPASAALAWLASELYTFAIETQRESSIVKELSLIGGSRMYQVHLARVLGQEEESEGIVAVLREVLPEERTQGQWALAQNETPRTLVDPVTGLHNRNGFSVLAKRLLKLAEQQCRDLAYLVCTVDCGEDDDANTSTAADGKLMAVARTLQESYRSSDVIARMGRNQFAVLVMGSLEWSVEVLRDRLHDAIQTGRTRGESGHQVGIQVGLMPYDPEYPRDVDELLARIPGNV